MVTRPPPKNQRQLRPAPRPFFLKEWRKFMGTKAVELAEVLEIERESYYRLEKNWWTISAGEMDKLAQTIGIKPSQFWFPPPTQGQDVVSLDDLVEEMSEPMKKAAINAVKGIAGR